MGFGFFSEVISGRTRANGFKLHQQWSRLDIKKKHFTERVGRCWNRLLKEVIESPSLDVCLRGMLRTWLNSGLGRVGLLIGLRDLKVFSNLNDCMIYIFHTALYFHWSCSTLCSDAVLANHLYLLNQAPNQKSDQKWCHFTSICYFCACFLLLICTLVQKFN